MTFREGWIAALPPIKPSHILARWRRVLNMTAPGGTFASAAKPIGR